MAEELVAAHDFTAHGTAAIHGQPVDVLLVDQNPAFGTGWVAIDVTATPAGFYSPISASTGGAVQLLTRQNLWGPCGVRGEFTFNGDPSLTDPTTNTVSMATFAVIDEGGSRDPQGVVFGVLVDASNGMLVVAEQWVKADPPEGNMVYTFGTGTTGSPAGTVEWAYDTDAGTIMVDTPWDSLVHTVEPEFKEIAADLSVADLGDFTSATPPAPYLIHSVGAAGPDLTFQEFSLWRCLDQVTWIRAFPRDDDLGINLNSQARQYVPASTSHPTSFQRSPREGIITRSGYQ